MKTTARTVPDSASDSGPGPGPDPGPNISAVVGGVIGAVIVALISAFVIAIVVTRYRKGTRSLTFRSYHTLYFFVAKQFHFRVMTWKPNDCNNINLALLVSVATLRDPVLKLSVWSTEH